MSIIPKTWHESWDDFMNIKTINELKKIEKEIGNNFLPKDENVLRFLQLDLNAMKCCPVS